MGILDFLLKKINKQDNSANVKKSVKKSLREKAEEELGLLFSEDYVHFIGEMNHLWYKGDLFLGLHKKDNMGTVKATKDARQSWEGFPMNMYVISLLGIDGIMILQDSSGKIYEYFPQNKPHYIFNNLNTYLNSIKE